MVDQPYPAYRPAFLQQGPANSCVINGKAMGWLNCTPTAGATGAKRASLGKKNVTPCAVRRETGDTTGGTTLNQVAGAVNRLTGVDITVRVGSNVIADYTAAQLLYNGRAFILQGNTASYQDEPSIRSTGTAVNHALFVNEGREWVVRNGVLRPEEVLVYDPAADARQAGWGRADQGSTWWDYDWMLEFAAKLRPYGDTDPRRLGYGVFYAGFFVDTEPYVVLKFGGRKTSPFPDRTRGDREDGRLINIYNVPNHKTGHSVRNIADGDLFTAWQVSTATTNSSYLGSKRWYGNRDGTEWVHEYRIRREGGTT